MIELAASFDSQLSSLAPYVIYLVVGAIVFIETGILFGFFLPGDSILFSAGLVAAAHDDVNIVILVSVIFIAAFFGDQVGFVLGRLVGRPYLDKHDSPRMKSMIARSERFYEQTGWWAVVAARFFPWIRTFVPPIAGASQMNYYKFLSANALGALLWGVGITLAGYYAATLPWVKTWSYAIAAFFICASLVSALVNYLRHRRQLPHTS
ncbi:MAG: rane-associated protein [Actinobacteria bacterium]|jgi:membrane-associated protein|nr:rane-associated protein [Actinomycetota bacterium]